MGVVAVHPHAAVAVVDLVRATRGVHRDLVVVDAQAIAMGVAVGEQTALEHLVRRETDTGHHVGRRESGLLDLGEVVVRVTVQLEEAHFDQRVVAVGPDLGQVERVVAIGGRFLLGHDLHVHLPAREVAFLDALVQVALRTLAVLGDHFGSLGVGQVLDALLGLEVELDPEALVVRIDEAEGMAAETMDVPIALRQAAVAEVDGQLMQRLGEVREKVPLEGRIAQVGARVTLHHVVEIGELERVAQIEHRGVVADQVPVALLGVETHGEAADVSLGIRRATLTGDGGEAQEHIGLLADLGEDLRPGVGGDVMGDGEGAVGRGAFRMHASLGDHFAIEVGELLEEPHVLQQHRATRTGGLHVLVIDHRCASGSGQAGLLFHLLSPQRLTCYEAKRLHGNHQRGPGIGGGQPVG